MTHPGLVVRRVDRPLESVRSPLGLSFCPFSALEGHSSHHPPPSVGFSALLSLRADFQTLWVRYTWDAEYPPKRNETNPQKYW